MSIVDNHVLGIQGAVYIGTAGTTADGLLSDEQEVSLKIANTIAKRATRGNPRKTGRVTTQELSIEMTIAKDESNENFFAIQAAAIGSYAIAVKAVDSTSGSYVHGWDADFYVESFEESQPLDDWSGVKVTLAYTDDYRSFTEIGD